MDPSEMMFNGGGFGTHMGGADATEMLFNMMNSGGGGGATFTFGTGGPSFGGGGGRGGRTAQGFPGFTF